MKTTIDMARESKVVPVLLTPNGEYFTFLERFEALVRADEREALLDIVYSYADSLSWNDEFQEAIKARGETK